MIFILYFIEFSLPHSKVFLSPSVNSVNDICGKTTTIAKKAATYPKAHSYKPIFFSLIIKLSKDVPAATKTVKG